MPASLHHVQSGRARQAVGLGQPHIERMLQTPLELCGFGRS